MSLPSTSPPFRHSPLRIFARLLFLSEPPAHLCIPFIARVCGFQRGIHQKQQKRPSSSPCRLLQERCAPKQSPSRATGAFSRLPPRGGSIIVGSAVTYRSASPGARGRQPICSRKSIRSKEIWTISVPNDCLRDVHVRTSPPFFGTGQSRASLEKLRRGFFSAQISFSLPPAGRKKTV